jgi:tRNA A-37 threonylcarbamoyl transferase component Bud32
MFTPAIRESPCPDELTLQQFLNDELSEADGAGLKEHIDSCPACQQVLGRLVDTLPGSLDPIAPLLGAALPAGAAMLPTLPPSIPAIPPPAEASRGERRGVSPPCEVPGYEVLAEVGRGGMGVVYKARQLRPDRIVALKMLLAGRHAEPKERTRFLHEAEAVAQLQHPNIVPLYEAGQHDDLPYFTLEFVAGGNLANLLQGKPLPPPDAARLVEQLARGMQYAHERGIIHRDLKPANILLGEVRGGVVSDKGPDPTHHSLLTTHQPKITDFGLAKNIADSTALTATGAVFGTPSYMAPEQARGAAKQASAAADIYALGAILYECLTGRPPFQGPTTAETLLQVLQDEPVPPSRLQRTMPRDLETICLKCLQKAPNHRYASAGELAEDLHHFQAKEPIRARPVGRGERLLKWCRRHPAVSVLSATVILLTLALGSLVTWQWRQAVTALAELRSEKAARALRQAAALPDAAPGRVPAILEELENNREEVLPFLRQLYLEEKDQHRRMRLALALLPVEPDTLREPLTDWMVHADDPAEVLLAVGALQRYRLELAAPLWAKAEDTKVPDSVRLRALVALAAYDPHNVRWQKVGPQLAEYLHRVNPLHRSQWTAAFRSVGQSLLAPLIHAKYYPLKLGTKLHYRGVTSAVANAQSYLQVADIEKIDGQAVLARLEAIERGNVVATEYVSSTAKGIFRHRYGAMEISPPLCLLSFPVSPGESWESKVRMGDVDIRATCRVVGFEEIEVPAGKYKAVIVHRDFLIEGDAKYSFIEWYAVGIGLVKQTTFSTQQPSADYLRLAGTRTVGLLASPLAPGPFLAGSALPPLTVTSAIVLERFEEGK